MLILCIAPIDAMACSVVNPMTFGDHLRSGKTIAILQVESLRRIHGVDADKTRGKLRLVETLKGPAAKFSSIEIDGTCNDLRLDVGGYYLIATSQTGSELKVDWAHSWILDISTEYIDGMPRYLYKSPTLDLVQGYISGKSLPSNFPSRAMLSRTHRFSSAEESEPIAP